MFSYGSPKNLRSRFKAEIVKKQHLGLEINYLSYIPCIIYGIWLTGGMPVVNRWYTSDISMIYRWDKKPFRKHRISFTVHGMLKMSYHDGKSKARTYSPLSAANWLKPFPMSKSQSPPVWLLSNESLYGRI